MNQKYNKELLKQPRMPKFECSNKKNQNQKKEKMGIRDKQTNRSFHSGIE